MGKKPPPETPEEKAARKQAEAARFGQGNQIESLVEAAGCSCKGLRLRDAIKSAILGEIPEFFEKDEERLARPVRAQLPAWDPKDKTRRMLDDYSEIVSELRREEINQDRANTLRVAGHVQKLIKGPGPPSVRKVDLIKRHARGEGLTVPEYLSEKKREDSKKIVRKRFKLKELGRRITAEANDPRPSRDEVRIGAEAVILSRLGSRAKALAAKRLKKAKRKGIGAMVLSELVYCSHLVGFNDFQMDNPLKIVSADLYWAGDRTARDKAELIKAGITHIVNCSRTSNFDGTGSNPFSAWINYFSCGFPDNASADFTDAIEQTYDFIDRSLSAHPRWVVLVHCASGVSRSVALVCHFLMRKQQLSFHESICLIQRRHPAAAPNASFVDQLKAVDKRLQRDRARRAGDCRAFAAPGCGQLQPPAGAPGSPSVIQEGQGAVLEQKPAPKGYGAP